ncbi:MAG: MOFRL family protein [Bilophila wadsworthia]
MPQSIWAHIEGGLQGRTPETPKADEPAFGRVRNVLVASVKQALEAAADEAARCGFVPRILTTAMSGEARRTAAQLVAEARRAQAGLRPGDAPLCLLAGGETTVTIRGSGKGGRNQEMALAATLELADDRGIDLICVGTDGTDGPTDAAGGYAFSGDLARLRAIGLHPKESLDATTATPCCSRPAPSCAPAPRAPMSWIWPSCWSGRNNRSRKLFLGLFGYVQGEKRRVIVLVHDRRVRTGSGTGRPGKALDADKRGAKRTGTAYRPSGLRGGNGPAGSTDMGGDHVWFMVFLGQPRVAARRVLRVRRVRGKSVRS